MRTADFQLIVLSLGILHVAAEDWPNWRGPQHNGISDEKLPANHQTAKIAWRAKVGTGFATVAVSGDSLVTLGNDRDHDSVWCLDAKTGETKWSHRYACPLDPDGHEGGPGSTPAIDSDLNAVFTLSKKGQAHCLDLAGGNVRWARDLRKQYELEPPRWSFSGSPRLVGDLVLLNVGSAGWALDKHTGETRWRSGTGPSGYASPIEKGDLALILSAKELVAVSKTSGEPQWRFPWDGSRVNAADPILSGERVLLSSSAGAILLDTSGGKPAPIWKNRNLHTYFNPGVLSGGHVYAIHGTTHRATELICLNLESGETVWSQPGFGNGALVAANGGKQMILFDKGQLTLFPTSAKQFTPSLRLQVLGGKCWTAPVFANGRIYCRNALGQLACVAFE